MSSDVNNSSAVYGAEYAGRASPEFNNMPSQAGSAHWFQGDADYGFDDDLDGDINGNLDDGGADSRDAKRRRIARACDMCRKKKIKCDGKQPKCSHCENYKTECIFTHVEKKRAPPKGAKYIEGLENRLGRMESLLRLSGLLGEDDGGRTDLGTLEKRLAERAQNTQHKSDTSSPPSNAVVNRQHTKESTTPTGDTQGSNTPPTNDVSPTDPPRGPANTFKRDQKDVDALADQMCSLITNNYGETRYIGSSSGFSIFSPKGIQWVNEKTGDTSFQHMIASASSDDKTGWDHWKPEVFNDLFQRRVFKPLPSRQECFALLKDYFENFNCMFPLFHEPTFMHLVDKHYSLEPYEGSGWWASLNVALAIAHRLRVMSNVVGQEEDDIAWAYLKNAMAVMTELTMRNTDLLSVQALLGMALFLQGTPNPQPSFFLISAAIRVAHSIGLHKRGAGFNLNSIEDEQRKRVFWIAYMMDKDICLRSGRPPAQDDDDMNVELPSSDPPDNVGNIPLEREIDGKQTLNLFRLMCTFAQIQSRVYKQLYSVRASQQSDGELLNTIGDLDAQLEEWKDSIPLDFRPEHEIRAAHTPLILHVVVLHFAYYNCLTTIHRMSVHHGYWTSRLSDFAIKGLNARPLNPRVFMSAALCVNAARTSIGLIRYIPQGDYACVWLILYYPVSALVTLFANILQNPQDARARSDLKLMSSVVSFLTMLERDVNEANGNVKRMLAVCAEFERIARVALDKTEREIRGRGKRKLAEREREKALKDRGSGQVVSGLEEGKTLEQMQIETQAHYRRPVQTSSLRASQGASSVGGSPNSWGGAASPPGGTGPEYRTPINRSASLATVPHLTPSSQQPNPMNGSLSNQLGNQQQQQQHQQQQHHPTFDPTSFQTSTSPSAPFPQDFSPGDYPLTGGGSLPSFSPNGGPHQHHPGDFPMGGASSASSFPAACASPNLNGNPSGSSAAGPFQQPFVPQDLWQMPMTLEWDWAEGLGLGSFTPGPMMDSGLYADVAAMQGNLNVGGMGGMGAMSGVDGGMNGVNGNVGNVGDGGDGSRGVNGSGEG